MIIVQSDIDTLLQDPALQEQLPIWIAWVFLVLFILWVILQWIWRPKCRQCGCRMKLISVHDPCGIHLFSRIRLSFTHCFRVVEEKYQCPQCGKNIVKEQINY